VRYKKSVFNYEFDMRKQPRFSTASGWLDIGHQGRPHMFGADEHDRPRLAAVLYGDILLTGVPFLPVFPERGDKLKVGHKWKMKVPPIVYSEEQALKPPKEHAILRQEWLETVDLNGFVCARISYQIEDGRADGLGAADGSFSMTGVVYFAIPEGIVVMDTAQVDASLMVDTDLVRRRWLKNHLLMHYEPLEAKDRKEHERKTWRYKYRPPPREEGHEATQRGRPRDGAPPSAEKAPRRWTREEYEAWLREAMRKKEAKKQKAEKRQDGAPPSAEEAPRMRTVEEVIAWYREEIRKREERQQEDEKRRDGGPPTPNEASRKRTLEGLKANLRKLERKQKEMKGQK
jgi:hypothetical protein